MSERLLAYHGDPATKAKYLKRLRMHRQADELVQRTGWETNGTTKGCAVGCTLDAYDHSRYPVELGIPMQVAYLEDAIFEGLDRAEALKWPEAFLKAIKPGADLTMVWPRFAHWLLTCDQMVKAIGTDSTVAKVVRNVADLYAEWIETDVKPSATRFESAASDARAASASRAASWLLMRDKLLELLKEAQVSRG